MMETGAVANKYPEQVIVDQVTGRVLARASLPQGWRAQGQLERMDSFDRPLQVRVTAVGPEGTSLEFRTGERYCQLGGAAKGANAMAALYGLGSSMQSSPAREIAGAAKFLDGEAAAIAERLGGRLQLLEEINYPTAFDESAARREVEREATNDAALQGAQLKACRVAADAAARVYALALGDGYELRLYAAGIVDGYAIGFGVPSAASAMGEGLNVLGAQLGSAAEKLMGRSGAKSAQAGRGFMDTLVDSGLLGGVIGRRYKEQRAARADSQGQTGATTPSSHAGPSNPAQPSNPNAADSRTLAPIGTGEVAIWGPRNLVTLVCAPEQLDHLVSEVVPQLIKSFTINPALAQEADAIKHNRVIEAQQQSMMAQQRQQAQFAAMRQAVNTQRQAIDDYQRAVQSRSDAQWAADRARSGYAGAGDADWTDRFSDAMRGVNTWVRTDGTEVETSTACDTAWENAAGDVVGGAASFDPGADWTSLNRK